MSEWPPRPDLAGLQRPPGPELRLVSGMEEATPLAAGAPGAALRIGLLGMFTVNAVAAAVQPAQGTLLLALALHRDGLLNDQLRCYLGADADHPKPSDSLRQLIVRARRSLGSPAEGQQWIEHLGGGLYRLHPRARTDWGEFISLSEHGIAAGDRATLRQALTLVRGRPFTGCYHWWLDIATIETAQAQITRAAAALARLDLAAGDTSSAIYAAWRGLAADPGADELWQALLRAGHASGDLRGVRHVWGLYLEMISSTDPEGGPHPGTTALYQQLTGGPGAA